VTRPRRLPYATALRRSESAVGVIRRPTGTMAFFVPDVSFYRVKPIEGDYDKANFRAVLQVDITGTAVSRNSYRSAEFSGLFQR